MRKIYETIVTHDSTNDRLVTADSGFKVGVAPVREADQWHSNPEQLIGASWAACLKATIDSILKAKQMTNLSKIEIKITLFFSAETRYEFHLEAKAAISDLSLDEAERIIKTAHRFCPVSKLIGQNPNVKLHTVNY